MDAMSEIRLNLGAAGTEIEGYTPIDIKDGKAAWPLTDYADNSVAEIRASHILEHFSHRNAPAVLTDWFRALAPGGLMRIAVPDFNKIIDEYKAGSAAPVEGYLMGGHVDDRDVHMAIYNRDKLMELMKAVGLVDLDGWESEISDGASLDISLNIQGRKPAAMPEGPFKVAACMSLPRLTFTDNFFCCMEALRPLSIPIRKYTGAFWGQCLTRCLVETIEEKRPDALLCIDYDTIFSSADVLELVRLLRTHPEVEAIAALQTARHKLTPLMTVQGADGTTQSHFKRDELQGELIEVATAHFGLTLIRTSALNGLPHPWFQGEPDPDGKWGAGRTDPDIWFWRKWTETGYRAAVALRVPVGHAELMIRWPNMDLEATYQSSMDWSRQGKPEGVWT